MKRRFSIEPSFIQSRTNDLLYAFMRSISTVNPQPTMTEYLSLKDLSKNRTIVQYACGLTSRQFTRALNKLLEENLIEIKDNNYYFPYDYDERYKLVDRDMLKYLINTRNLHVIRIYLILLNFYSYKQGYVFTINEIKEQLGYAESNKDFNKIIQDILTSLKREGIIKIEKFWEDCVSNTGKRVPSPRYRLLFVASKESEIQKSE